MITQFILTETFMYGFNYNNLVQYLTLTSQNKKSEHLIHFRCPHHQKGVNPAGVQQVLLFFKVGQMQHYRLQWAKTMGIRTVVGRAIRWRGLLPKLSCRFH